MGETKNVIQDGESRASARDAGVPIAEQVADAISSIPRSSMTVTKECRYGKYRDVWVIVSTMGPKSTYALHCPSLRFFRTHIGSNTITSTKVREVIHDDRTWLYPLLTKVIPEGASLLSQERTGELTPPATSSGKVTERSDEQPPMHFDVNESRTVVVEFVRTMALRLDQIQEMVKRNSGGKRRIPDSAKLSVDDAGYVKITWTDGATRTDVPADLLDELLSPTGSGEV
jgi:hypothetical protein